MVMLIDIVGFSMRPGVCGLEYAVWRDGRSQNGTRKQCAVREAPKGILIVLRAETARGRDERLASREYMPDQHGSREMPSSAHCNCRARTIRQLLHDVFRSRVRRNYQFRRICPFACILG